MPSMPNILFIQTDQLTIDVLAAYGNPVAVTPAIDQLAATGVVFDNCYCNFPLCAPSRASMSTGMLASKIGAFDNAAELPASIPTYAHYLREAGYETCLSGKMHYVGPDQLHGFETRLTTDIYPGDFSWTPDWSQTGFHGATDARVLTDSGVCSRNVQIDYDEAVTFHAVQKIYDTARRDTARTDTARPFFIQVSYTHPHDPYLCQQDHWDIYENVDIPPPRTGMKSDDDNDPHSIRLLAQHGFDKADVPGEIIQQARRAYCGSVSYIDDQVAKLCAALDDSGQRENTVIIFGSDHGEMLGERGLWLKKTFFEPALRVPLIINYPKNFDAAHIGTPCSLVDLLPTFMGLATGMKWDGAIEPLDGSDLGPIMHASGDDMERPVYAELLSEGILAPVFMIRRGRFKLITSEGGDPDMLYDLDRDPDEQTNLATNPDHADMLAMLRKEAAEKWDSHVLAKAIVLSQRRRHLIRAAHNKGQPPRWDFDDGTIDDRRWYRGHGNYNDWAMDYLPDTKPKS